MLCGGDAAVASPTPDDLESEERSVKMDCGKRKSERLMQDEQLQLLFEENK